VLVLVRHGRTAANARGLLLGRLDPPLDELGKEQAALVAKALGPVARVVSSPLARARETASWIDAPLVVDDRWIELDYGEYDGLPLSQVPAEMWNSWRADSSYAPPGGESLLAMSQRVSEACEELVDEAIDQDVVVVSHVSPIKAAVAWALGVDVSISWRTHLHPASITHVGVGRFGPMLRTFNVTSHLAAQGGVT
jgi:broad specificity phosphatase PhoE